ncbi:MAG TPA: tetraacyldisaccharide 4'-kinase [Rhizomicrobium sp.]|jgi:tetraacyldisaccharide 4'-kinase|nr:tetraacyldisaccharide 4'-kinase [Rhizomicrobium sp.]
MREPDFWSSASGGARVLRTVLSPAAWVYGKSVAWKAGRAKPFRARAKVICVGNLTVGGTGKTPVSIAIAQALAKRGLNVAILTRGYGGRAKGPLAVDREKDLANEVGDEPLIAAASVPVIVAHDRAAGAEFGDSHGADVIVMDDGHQNFSIAKDLSLVVVDAQTGFGNGRVLPAGPLREPVPQGLARADAVIMVGDGTPDLGSYKCPALRAHIVAHDKIGLNGKPAVAFAGIGRPEKFFNSLRELGADILETVAAADHHIYSASEIARLKAKARGSDALLITTEKDFVRLTPAERDGIDYLPVQAAFDEPAALEQLLDRVCPRTVPPTPA